MNSFSLLLNFVDLVAMGLQSFAKFVNKEGGTIFAEAKLHTLMSALLTFRFSNTISLIFVYSVSLRSILTMQ